jgi:hypothetical protein
MTESELTPEQIRNFNLIELRIVNQRYVELLDDLLKYNVPTNNKKLRNQLKATYVMLDKETKGYNELYEATPTGTSAFYEVTKTNAELIMSNVLLDKNIIHKTISAHRFKPKAVEGILDKILKEKQ